MFSSESGSQGVLCLSTKLSLATILDRKPALTLFSLLQQSPQVYGRQKIIAALSVRQICLRVNSDIKGIFQCVQAMLCEVKVKAVEYLFAM